LQCNHTAIIISIMRQQTSITIRRIEPELKKRLRLRAAAHGRSMEEEARAILRSTLSTDEGSGRNWVENIRRRAAAAGWADVKLPAREPMRSPPDFK